VSPFTDYLDPLQDFARRLKVPAETRGAMMHVRSALSLMTPAMCSGAGRGLGYAAFGRSLHG